MDRAFCCRYSLPLPSGNDDFPAANPVRFESRHTSEQSAVSPACSIAPYLCIATWFTVLQLKFTVLQLAPPGARGLGGVIWGFFLHADLRCLFLHCDFETAALSCTVGRWWKVLEAVVRRPHF